MANKLLLPVYKKIFDKTFSYGNFDDRLQMQKMTYLLQEEGINMGHYGFDWYKHGPYSQALLDDMYFENGTTEIELQYTEFAEDRIKKLKEMFNYEEAVNTYGLAYWTECLASIHFLKYKEMGSNTSIDIILDTLKERKPHLNNNELNRKAYEFVEKIVA